jgi:hypothetical protein
VFLDKPFLIWAGPTNDLIGSNAVASNSTAQFDVEYNDNIPGDHRAFAWLAFFFIWQNDIDSAKAVSAQTNLFVRGQGNCGAVANYLVPLSSAECDLWWDASFRIMFWEHGSGTDVPPQASQKANIIPPPDLRAIAENVFGAYRIDVEYAEVSQQVPLSYTNLVVRPGQVIVFAVSLHVTSYLDGGSFGPSPDSPSWVLSRLYEPFGFVGCPFVELQVTALG